MSKTPASPQQGGASTVTNQPQQQGQTPAATQPQQQGQTIYRDWASI